MFEICSDLSKKALNILLLSTFKRGQSMAKWPNHFFFWQTVSKKAKWQPCIVLTVIGKKEKYYFYAFFSFAGELNLTIELNLWS